MIFIANLDHATGYELAFSIFYLFPITIASWYVGYRVGLFLCIFSALAWLCVDYTSGHEYSYWAIPCWNAVVRFSFFLLTSYLVAELKIYTQIIENLAQTDTLTGLLNAYAFKKISQMALDRALRYPSSVAIAYIDVDNFKKINDTLGHSEGDYVLKQIGSILLNSFRKTDVVGRIGGDEFAVLLPEIEPVSVEGIFYKVQKQLLEMTNSPEWKMLGFSIGIAIFEKIPKSIDEALKIADRLMYQVKKNGKNSFLCEKI